LERRHVVNKPFVRTHAPQDWPGAHYMDELEVQAVERVVRARSPFRYYGANLQLEVEQFERELASFVGRSHCVGVASGTAALEVSMAALEVGPGDEVIVPGYFWVSTVAAVVKNFAIPVLVDVDDSFSLDPHDLLRKITARTKAVIIVHMGGVIGQVERVAEICRERGIRLIEDCAQSIGAAKFGRQSGSFGDVAIFSFQLNKSCTAGEGGAIVTDDAALYARAAALHDIGYVRDSDGNLVTNTGVSAVA
jgi:dTDP-4-amino-4,6-dideoxygalactose transaminase